MNIFPDRFIHIGGDEVDGSCWMNNTNVVKWMTEQRFTTAEQVEGYYIGSLLALLRAARANMTFLAWQEVFDNGDPIDQADTIVNVWKNAKELANITKRGFRAVLSSCWYLNEVHYGPDWRPFYACDPHNFTSTEEQKRLVVGGTTTMWGEFIDGTNVISTFWPRASAVAERLWSNENVRDANTFLPRYSAHRCRLLQRGYQAGPPDGPDFCP